MERGLGFTWLLVAAFIPTAAVSTRAAQFEDYTWGDSRDEVLQTLLREHPDTRRKVEEPYTTSGDAIIRYNDSIFHRLCKVTLYVNENHGLYRLFVKWDTLSVPMSLPVKVVEALSAAYGEPKHDKPHLVDRYLWESSGNNGQKIDVKLLSLPAGDSNTSPGGYLELEYIDVERSKVSVAESTAEWQQQRARKNTEDASRF